MSPIQGRLSPLSPILAMVAICVVALPACAQRAAPQPVAATVVSIPFQPSHANGQELQGEEVPSPQLRWTPGEPVPESWLRPDLAIEVAPEQFHAAFETTQGNFEVLVRRSWAPHGVDRFHHLLRIGYYTDIAFYRAIQYFMVQFGIHGMPEVNLAWKDARIPDDPVVRSNDRGTIAFAMAGPGSRTTQLFINTVDNRRLDTLGFAPFGEVADGMDVVDRLFTGYGEGIPMGTGPSQTEMLTRGNQYVRAEFPDLDYILQAWIAR